HRFSSSAATNIMANRTTGYVNCISKTSEHDVLWELTRQATRGRVAQTHGRPASDALEQLKDLDTQFVAVLDEANMLADARTLYVLYELATVTLVLITVDDLDLSHSDVADRVWSRLASRVRIELEPYTHGEMATILRARADRALRPRSYTDEAIDRMTELASGNARLGVAVLRRAANKAHSERADKITAATVEAVEDAAREEVREMNVSTLGTHQRLLYKIIKEAGEIDASELHKEYEQRIGDPKSKPMRRKYLQSLRYYNLIKRHGQSRDTTYTMVIND
ncbi:MAG: Cdc6/Cdc18 family protein, partial [Halobacteriaceae archaeon]